MDVDEIFIERLKLLIIMSKAYLKSYPLGDFRKAAVHENAEYVFHQSISHSFLNQSASPSISTVSEMSPLHLFYQRAQLLAVMARSFADGTFLGSYRKRSMVDNIDAICDHLSEQFHLADAPFLKVA